MSVAKASSIKKRKRDSDQSNCVADDKASKKRRSGRKDVVKVQPDRQPIKEEPWAISGPIGGKFIDVDPLFSPDEKHIIFATESSANVYSTADSSLVHALPAQDSCTISSYALSPIHLNELWVSTLQGEIFRWNLETGTLSARWVAEGPIYSILASKNPIAKDEQETLFCVTKMDGWRVMALRPESDEPDSQSVKSTTLLKGTKPISGMKLCYGGRNIIATTTDSLLLGEVSAQSSNNLGKLVYTWREVICKEAPICFDVRARNKDAALPVTGKSKKTDMAQLASVDVVIGGVKGCLFVFEDIFTSLGQLEKPSIDVEKSSPLNGRSMHWHREAVGAVSWSKDGNYIISGGRETVLVIWQLRTGNKQFLPNLESPIQSLVVSPAGSSYAVRLGDNSVMTLSTSELKPTAYITGLQTISYSRVIRPAPELATVESTETSDRSSCLNRTAAVLHPNASSRILAAVPSTQSARGPINSQAQASYLQDFDVSIMRRHDARQALARNNAISSNLGPEGNRILEPEVIFLQISPNGKWLASVDEWTIPRKEVKKLFAPGDSTEGYRESRLRFWSWDAEGKVWLLNSVVEEPHKTEDTIASGSVLHLAASPTGAKFATVGTDSMARIWRSKSRTTQSRTAITADGGTLQPSTQTTRETWWTVQCQIPLEMSMFTDPLAAVNPFQAILGYSQDGSVLAAYLGYEHDFRENAIYFIDATQGVVRNVKRDTDLCAREIFDLKFLERYLICLAQDAVTVWDVTAFDLHASYPLSIADPHKARSHRPIPHLAVDYGTRTFAIAVPQKPKKAFHTQRTHAALKYETVLSIYSPRDAGQQPVFSATLPRLTVALLASSGFSKERNYSSTPNRGYVLIDIGAETRVVTPDRRARDLPYGHVESPVTATDDGSKADTLGHDPREDERQKAVNGWGSLNEFEPLAEIENNLKPVRQDTTEDTRRVVQKEHLAEVFDQPSQKLPPITDLFWGVFSLYADKPPYDEKEPVGAEDQEAPRADFEGSDADKNKGLSDSSSDSDSASDSDDDDDDSDDNDDK